jgi:2,5-diamino-6-(ribosylamino)-4(3H)-pyrimidinone 5'-phosphate reductase
MIEGGSRVLSSFLRSPPRSDGSPVVDSVIITVAPMLIGDGVGVVPKVICFRMLYRKKLTD